jgi:hypothetical protein
MKPSYSFISTYIQYSPGFPQTVEIRMSDLPAFGFDPGIAGAV